MAWGGLIPAPLYRLKRLIIFGFVIFLYCNLFSVASSLTISFLFIALSMASYLDLSSYTDIVLRIEQFLTGYRSLCSSLLSIGRGLGGFFLGSSGVILAV